MMDAITLARCAGTRLDRAERHAAAFTEAMQRYAIDTPLRQCMFLANAGHESGGLQWPSELWGPTPTQKLYERDFGAPWPPKARTDRNWKAFNLGNVNRGDGRLFSGHGWFQTTGRSNHAAARDRIRARFPDLAVPDFELEPSKLADSQWAALAAADYVDMRNLNEWADRGDFDGYCDIVNLGRHTERQGDSNGWVDRAKLYAAARLALGLGAL